MSERGTREGIDVSRLVLPLRSKKAAEWGKYYASRPKEETPEDRVEFWKKHAAFDGYLQALDDLEQNAEACHADEPPKDK